MRLISVILCVSFSIACFKASEIKLPGKLIFAHVLFRHGDRTPIKPYPNDPYGKSSFWTVDWGQLTDIGQQQQYKLGLWLRSRYNTLISDQYSKNEIYVISTIVNRTIMSAKANLAGLYATDSRPSWDDVVNIESQDEKILAMNTYCPAYDNALQDLKHSDYFKIIRQKYRDVFEYITEQTGKAFKTVESVQSLYSTLHIEDMNQFKLPAWTHYAYPEPLSSLSARSFATATFTRKLARLKAGPLIKTMLQRFKDKSEGKLNPDRSLWLYSAHDSTVANVLNSLNVFDWHNPPFTAAIMFEMRQFKRTNLISIYYKNETKQPLLLSMPGCGISCPLNKIFEIYSDILPNNEFDECEEVPLAAALTVNAMHQLNYKTFLFILSIIFVVLMLFFCKIVKAKVEKIDYNELDGSNVEKI